MKTLYLKVLTCVISASVSVSVMASGPRVTSDLFEVPHNEIVAVETPPLYSSHNPSGGMAFEIIMAVLSSEKESATLTTYPIQKLVDYYITQGKVLAALGTNLNLSEGQKKSVISIPVALIREQYIYYKPAHPKGISWDGKLSDLEGLTYGAHAGEDTSAFTTAEIKVDYARSLFLFKKLKTQQVDFIREPVLSAEAMIKANFAADENQFGIMESVPQKSVCIILFNLQNPEAEKISKKFRQGLSTILKNGKYQAIIEKYEGKTPLSAQYIEEFKALWKKELLEE